MLRFSALRTLHVFPTEVVMYAKRTACYAAMHEAACTLSVRLGCLAA